MMAWDYISDYRKEEIYEYLERFNESRVSGIKDREALAKLFEYYNEFVSFKYPKVSVSMTCGKCVNTVTNFFKKQYELDGKQ